MSLYVLILLMSRFATLLPPVPDTQLGHAFAAWVCRAPRHTLSELADSDARADAADALSEIIVAEMSMAYPELVESSSPPLPFWPESPTSRTVYLTVYFWCREFT